MTDAYWDELGIAWRANIPDTDALTARLRVRLRRQTLVHRANIVLATIIFIYATAAGAFVAWRGIWGEGTWRNTIAGILILVLVAVSVALTFWQLRGKTGDTRNLSNMIDLAISRAERISRGVRAMYIGCAMTAFFVAAMWFVSPAFDRFPQTSYIVECFTPRHS